MIDLEAIGHDVASAYASHLGRKQGRRRKLRVAFVAAIAVTKPKHAASSVFTATTEMRRSVAPSVDPGLNPIHPNTSTSVPMTT